MTIFKGNKGKKLGEASGGRVDSVSLSPARSLADSSFTWYLARVRGLRMAKEAAEGGELVIRN